VDERQARLLIESLRSFGGELRDCLVWIFTPGVDSPGDFYGMENVIQLPLRIAEPYRGYILADKVFACAQAEELVGAEVRSLVWVNLDCLVVNPPVLFDLGQDCDAALRPVHVRNVGSPAGEAPDEYWAVVYRAVGVESVPYTVESFVDFQVLRPYFNTHCFAIHPARKVLQAWREHFKSLVADQQFQASLCRDELHQVFLHQVVFSALIVKCLDQKRIRMLPPEYSYPLHLQQKVLPSRRIDCLNRMICAVYEEEDPLGNVEVEEPLKSWLRAHQSQQVG
jgi:hypothetical protein